mmetsp:Transcript_14741/g.18651  ORF Transcript_14741/g.18651 Transcript_14741/m.18651 type:complete len:232 (-) Transcript_14741:7-702(-)
MAGSGIEIVRKICSACTKPNIRGLDSCSGCGGSLEGAAISVKHSCAFCDVVDRTDEQNYDAGELIRYRDGSIVVFDSKFPMSRFQWNVIPCQHIESVVELRATHLELLDQMYKAGHAVISKILQQDGHLWDASEGIYFGYNYPPSVPHLHLYIVVCPVVLDDPEQSLFPFPRSIPHQQVMDDLKEHGRVLVGNERNDKESHEEVRSEMIKENTARWHFLHANKLAASYEKQ